MDKFHDISKKLKSKALVSKFKRKLLKNVWLVRVLIFSGVLLILFLIGLIIAKAVSTTSFPYYSSLGNKFLFPKENTIQTINGKINFVVLGKGGEGHEAPDLTDTIMFVSLDVDNKKARLVSLPRDMWIASLRAKINSAYYWGKEKQEGGGLSLAKSTIEEVVGEPVSYAIVLDFSGFKDIIDAMGGVDVEINEGFIDEKYPIAGREDDMCNGDPEYACRYEKIEFAKGVEHMDGQRALKFVRSRQAIGDQGTDIARAARQQIVVEAIKQKLLSKDVVLSPNKMAKIFWEIKGSMETDLSDEQLATLARYFYEARTNVKSISIPDGILVNPPISRMYDNQYVFVTKTAKWDDIHTWIDGLFNN